MKTRQKGPNDAPSSGDVRSLQKGAKHQLALFSQDLLFTTKTSSGGGMWLQNLDSSSLNYSF